MASQEKIWTKVVSLEEGWSEASDIFRPGQVEKRTLEIMKSFYYLGAGLVAGNAKYILEQHDMVEARNYINKSYKACDTFLMELNDE